MAMDQKGLRRSAAEKASAKAAARSAREAAKEAARAERGAKKRERQLARIASMPAGKREKALERMRAKEELRGLAPEQRKAAREEERARRSAAREARAAARLASMPPAKMAKHLLKKAMSKEERKAMRDERKRDYAFLAANWSESIPPTVPGGCSITHIILDGNNLRGGGPSRHSRREIVQLGQAAAATYAGASIVVYFDGRGRSSVEDGGVSNIKSKKGWEHVEDENVEDAKSSVEVRFSGGREADDVIVEWIERLSPSPGGAEQVLLITCDRGLAIRALRLGSHVMKNKVFKEIVVGDAEP